MNAWDACAARYDNADDMLRDYRERARERRTAVMRPRFADTRPAWSAPKVVELFRFAPPPAGAFASIDCQTPSEIMLEVARKHQVKILDIVGPWRMRQITLARQEAMWRLRHETTFSYPAIGRLLGNRDHTTVYHGVSAHQARIDRGEVAHVG